MIQRMRYIIVTKFQCLQTFTPSIPAK